MAIQTERDRDRQRLAARLRSLRRERSMTTRALAERAGVSASMVSQIETGRSGVSLESLRRIAAALNVPVVEFLFDETTSPDRSRRNGQLASVVRRDERRRLSLPQSNFVLELLTPDLEGTIEFVWIEVEPGHPPAESMSHPGEECALVLSGTMHFIIGDEEYDLGAGDAIAFDSTVPHRVENRGTEKLVQISAITPPRF